MQLSIAVGVSLPREIITRIDNERGDVSRSRYVLRMVQKVYKDTSSGEGQKNNLHPVERLTYSQPNESNDP
jgi:metal-responsive CopG/Arc/MetJ family transcriptional regulator